MPDEDDLRKAVDNIVDVERLLPGEDPQTTYLEDAEHWQAAYAELLGFKHDIVGTAEESSARLRSEVQPEARADLTLLRAERDRLRRRYEFWRKRVQDLRRK